jgi:HD-GYP domain-containing protein (c-di-GMP phosphodiesterase class II)
VAGASLTAHRSAPRNAVPEPSFAAPSRPLATPVFETAPADDSIFAPWSAPLVVEATPAAPALAAGAHSGVTRTPVGRSSAAAPVPSRRETAVDAARPLRRALAQLRDILRLSQDFDAAFGTSRLLDVLVLSVVSVARVETVLFFAARGGEYRLTHHRGMAPDAIQGLRLRGDTTMVQAALAASRGVALEDTPQVTEEERMWARQHGLSHAVPFRFKEEVLGLLLLGAPAEAEAPDLEMLASLLAQAGMAYDRARLYETLQDRTLGVVRGLITLIEARSGFDCGSTEHVVRYTQALARELQYPADAVSDLVYGAVLRDVGMLKVSETLLRSAQDLTADQWESIRRHPQEGAAIMRQMRFGETALDVVLHHHEAYNGEGYPMGLRGRAIPLGARIVAVAESYVKMLMDRPYRKALGKAEALESLAENWGLRYDPLVVDALVRVVNRELSMGLRGDSDLARDLFGV